MKKRISLLLALVMLVTIFAGCNGNNKTDNSANSSNNNASQSPTDTADKKEEQKEEVAATSSRPLRRASVGAFATLDPGYRTQLNDLQIVNLTYEKLYRVNEKMEYTPELATDMEISEDGLTYTFTIKEGVKFQNGDPLTVDDIVFSFNRAKELPATTATLADMVSIEAPDDHTIVITAAQLNPIFQWYICQIDILSEKEVTAAGDNFGAIPAGTGRYIVEVWEPDEKVVLKRNPDYHGDMPQIETIEYAVMGDSTSALMAFEAGEFDFFDVPTSDWERIQSSNKYGTAEMPSTMTRFIGLNNKMAPLDNKLFRQALHYATNKEEIILGAMEGLGTPASQVGVPEVNFACPSPEDTVTFEYNPEKAKELLAEAGYPDGYTFEIPAACTSTSALGQTVLTILQDQWADVGVHFEIELVDSAALTPEIKAGKRSICFHGFTLSVDAGRYSRIYGTDGDLNRGHYSNPEVDELYAKGAATLDSNERIEIYHELYNIVNEESPYIPLWWESSYYAWDKDLNVDLYTPAYAWSWNE